VQGDTVHTLLEGGEEGDIQFDSNGSAKIAYIPVTRKYKKDLDFRNSFKWTPQPSAHDKNWIALRHT
jgi:hypothetical protein